MSDKFSQAVRSKIMSHIRKTDTRPEMIVRKFLYNQGFRYRLYSKNLPGHPDIVLRKFKTVIFVNGCFWHMHLGCKYNRLPKSKMYYWKPKLEGNAKRDKLNRDLLINSGWEVITVWECELEGNKKSKTLKKLITSLKKINIYLI